MRVKYCDYRHLIGILFYSMSQLLTCSTSLVTFGSYRSKKVKASHTCYRALGAELIPVYRQSARR